MSTNAINTTLRTLGLLVLALFGIIHSTGTAGAQTARTITLVSGNGPIGSRDLATQFSSDGGVTFQDAFIIAPDFRYDVLPGAQYVNRNPDTSGPESATTRFRTTFVLPDCYSNPSLTVAVHADNVATVFLNGTQIGQQLFAEDPANFLNPAETFTSADPSLFHAGSNTIEFDIFNFTGPTAFAYKAEVSVAGRVAIDVRPGTYPNSINLGSNGNVPVAILSTPTFDAGGVNPISVSLAGASVSLRGNGTPMASSIDVNDDGLPDLVVHVSTQALQLSGTDTEVILEGLTFDGRCVTGADTVRIVP